MFKFLFVVLLVNIISFTNGSNSERPIVTPVVEIEPVDYVKGLTWDGRTNILYYHDTFSGKVFSYNYKTKKVNYITLNGYVSPVILTHSEKELIVGLNRSLVAVQWDGTTELKQATEISTLSNSFPGSRCNVGGVDKNGILWISTVGGWDQSTGIFSQNEGALYKVTKENLQDPTVVIAGVNISTGITWNAANDKLFYSDTNENQITVYDYDLASGSISNPSTLFDVKDYPEITGLVDGIAMDVDENLWIALYGGFSVIQIDSTCGKLLQKIDIPVRDVSSVMWGGPVLDILYVSTARISLNAEEKLKYPLAGSIFAITNLNTNGRPVFNADII